MNIEIVDYSDVYFSVLRRQEVPRQRGGKFVIMVSAEERHVVFSPKELSAYHANIVERFLDLRDIEGDYSPSGDFYRSPGSPWQVEAGGHWQYDQDGTVLRIFGRSKAYGGPDLVELATQLHDAGAFDGAKVSASP